MEQDRRTLLEQLALSSSTSGRVITGTTRDANQQIIMNINNTSYQTYSDANKKFTIELPETLNITSLYNMCATGSCQSQLVTIDISKIGDVSNCTTFQYMFDSQNYLTNVKGLSKVLAGATSVKTAEGMFRSCLAITSIDLGNLHTSTMSEKDSSRNGLANLFFHSSIVTTVLPSYHINIYPGSAGFEQCTQLRNVTFVGDIQVSLDFSYCPLTIESMRSILSHLSATHVNNATMKFSNESWSLACEDAICKNYIRTAKSNGWILPGIIIYINKCQQQEDFSTESSLFVIGTEADTSHSKYGQVYVIINQDYDIPTTYFTIDLDTAFDWSEGSNITFSMTGMGAGVVRSGVTIQSSPFIPVLARLVDSTGNKSDFIHMILTSSSTEQTIGPNVTYSDPIPLSSFTGVNLQSICKIEVIFNNNLTESAKPRKKGIWFNSISVA